jgi:hypothetical protein
MYRNPFFDAYAGAMLALGGPMAFLLPQRIAVAMLTLQHARPEPAEARDRALAPR